MERVEDISKRSAGSHKKGMDDGANAAGRFAMSLAGIAAAAVGPMALVNALKQEYRELLRRQREAMVAQQGAGETLREVRKVFTPDATMNVEQMEKRLLDVAAKHGSSAAVVGAAAMTGFSAKGPLTNEQSMSAIEAAVRVAPNNAGEAGTLAGRYEDVMKATGIGDARAVAGWLTSVQRGSRIANMAGVGQNAVPAITAMVASGDSAEQAAEVYNTINQMMSDEEGAQSRTAAINLQSQLQEFLPDIQGTQARLKAVQSDPKLRAKFLKGASSETASKNFLTSLVSADAKAMGYFDAAVAGTPALDDRQIPEFEGQIDFFNGGPFQGAVDAKQRNAANLEASRLGRGLAGRQAAAREILNATLGEIDLPGLDGPRRMVTVGGFDAAVSGGGGESQNPERFAAQVLESILTTNRAGLVQGGVSSEDQALIREQIALLKQIADSNAAMAKEQQQRDPPHVMDLPEAAHNRAPAAAMLGR